MLSCIQLASNNIVQSNKQDNFTENLTPLISDVSTPKKKRRISNLSRKTRNIKKKRINIVKPRTLS
jgi:hypothetical protein